ncbi:hypothetical protein [Nonomuraea sp. NPDC052265]|uniref:hypothetical protein n=1 Tax=Nonomuraea sp. NPDC052265 TaxID=3364374 RepID=UPI0037C79A7D
MRLEDLSSGSRVVGVVPGETVSVVAAQWHGSDALELTYKTLNGGLGQQVLFRADEAKLSFSDTGSRPFDADAEEFRLVAEAQRISLAGLFDPMLAVATSDVQPLPHQIRAVYGECSTARRCVSSWRTTRVPARRSWLACTSRSSCFATT